MIRSLLVLIILSFSPVPVLADACCSTNPIQKDAEGAPLPDQSVFHLDGNWTSQDGEIKDLKAFAGRPSLTTMFFASCSYACPMLIEDIKALLKSVPSDVREQLNVLMLSFDTDRDHPKALATFAKQRGLPTPPWTLMHSDADTILETAAVLGVRYRKDKEGNFAHSNIITLLNAQGEIVFQLNGLRTDPAPMVKAIESLLTPSDGSR